MPAGSELLKGRPAVTILLNSHFGGGKTRQMLGFEKLYAIGFDPNGLDVIKQKSLSHLHQNLIWYEYISPANDDELRDVFRSTPNKEGKKGLLYQYLEDVKIRAEKGEIQTLGLDGLTYLADLRWKLVTLDEVEKSSTTGNVDTQAMYRKLGIWLQTFFMRDLLPIASRFKLNVVCTCHLKREGEETVEGSKKTGRAGKINKLSDIAPYIEGGFRNKIEGLFGASIYLERKLDGTKIIYLAHSSIKAALGSIIDGKNRYGLPQTIDVTDKSLSEIIRPYLMGTNGQVEASAVTNVVKK